mmetsp:Transcript_65457/g.211039  ORF Transcript_65457/g.211039 Transcript_65457/m.211039 type:complete len:272 (+) Transcript_65457:2219-3034(+)
MEPVVRLHPLHHSDEVGHEGHVGTHGLGHPGVHDLQHHLVSTPLQRCVVHLSDGGCGQGLVADAGKDLGERPPKLRGDCALDGPERQGPGLVATCRQGLGDLLREQCLLRGDGLAHLHLEATVPEHHVPDPLRHGREVGAGPAVELLLGRAALQHGRDLGFEGLVLVDHLNSREERGCGAPPAPGDVQHTAEEAPLARLCRHPPLGPQLGLEELQHKGASEQLLPVADLRKVDAEASPALLKPLPAKAAKECLWGQTESDALPEMAHQGRV